MLITRYTLTLYRSYILSTIGEEKHSKAYKITRFVEVVTIMHLLQPMREHSVCITDHSHIHLRLVAASHLDFVGLAVQKILILNAAE